MTVTKGINAIFVGVYGYPSDGGDGDVYMAFGLDLLNDGNNFLIEDTNQGGD